MHFFVPVSAERVQGLSVASSFSQCLAFALLYHLHLNKNQFPNGETYFKNQLVEN